jgi:SAM-dependent methyltransferase
MESRIRSLAMTENLGHFDDVADFLKPRCDAWHLDVYHSRNAVLRAITEHMSEFQGTVLDVGCGVKPYRRILLSPPSRATQYLGLDLAELRYRNDPDMLWDGHTIPLPDAAVESAISTEVLEHCPDPGRYLSEVNRVLKPGGLLLLSVPFLWPLHDVPHDEFRYTPFSLRRLFDQAGFTRIEIRALGGWDAALAQMIGLWVRRRPMPDVTRRVLQRLMVPLCRRLLARDQPPTAYDAPGMVTGFCVTARACDRMPAQLHTPKGAPR